MNAQDLLLYIQTLIQFYNWTAFGNTSADFQTKSDFYGKLTHLLLELDKQHEHYLFFFNDENKIYLQKDNLGYLDDEEAGEDFQYCETEIETYV